MDYNINDAIIFDYFRLPYIINYKYYKYITNLKYS